jgi:hypothetical protein
VGTKLIELAHARSGDKGSHVNIGLIAKKEEHYPILLREVTAERVKKLFAEFCKGEVIRYELPNLNALNFVLKDTLCGGGTLNLRLDSQGKSLGMMLLRMEIDASGS